MATRLKTAPASEPISVDEAKAHLRVTFTDDDSYIASLVTAARIACEQSTQRAFITQTWEKFIDAFPADGIDLPYPPTLSLTSIKYIDINGTLQTLSGASYKLDVVSTPGWVVPAYGYTWPTAREEINAVTLEYITGYGSAASVPQPIKQAMHLLVGQWYENREAASEKSQSELPFGVCMLLAPYVVINVL